MIPLNLPQNYNWVNPGHASIEHECPWMVPESVDFINAHIRKEWKVLEVGSGGSSFFFARRCSKVLAIENFASYYDTIKQSLSYKALSDKGIADKLELKLVTTEQLIDVLSSLEEKFDVISIDHGVHHPSRSDCLESVIKLWTGEMLVMDNWGKKSAWPRSWNISNNLFRQRYPSTKNCDIFDFFHPLWAGRGTRVILKTQINN